MQHTSIASSGERIIASLWDGLVFLPFITLDRYVDHTESQLLIFLYFGVTWQLGWLYSTLLHGYRGQTLGKIRVRIQVVRSSDGSPIGYRRAALRDLPYIILVLVATGFWIHSYIAWFGGWFSEDDAAVAEQVFSVVLKLNIGWVLLECVSMLFHPQRRAIHDLIAGTIVVRKP